MKGKLFVVSGPSGVGKNTLLNAVIDRSENVRYSVSATSRPIRPGEVDGKSHMARFLILWNLELKTEH